MIYPTRRAVALTALGAPVSVVLGVVMPDLWVVGLAWLALMAGMLLGDAVLSPVRGALSLTVDTPVSLPAGGTGDAVVRTRFAGRAPAAIAVSLEADPRLTIEPPQAETRLAQNAAATVFRLVPHRRGDPALHRVSLRWRGPLGLLWRQYAVVLDRVVPVLPNVGMVKQEAVRLFSRTALFGLNTQLDTGDSTEFHALKEFQPGDDRRTLSWRQSARHGKLLAKEHHAERNRTIVLALDTGRLMCEPLAGLPKLDHGLNAALLLAYVGLKLGDRVGVFAFDAHPTLWRAPVTGAAAFGAIQHAAAGIDYSTAETNFTLGLTQLSGHVKRRSLMVVFTDFADTTSAELMIETIERLLENHFVLFVTFRDAELLEMIRAEPASPEMVSRAVIAQAMLREREVALTRLRHIGIEIIEASPGQVGPALVNRYLDLKRRDRL